MTNKPLYLFVGKSASGKTTIANLLEKEYGCKQVQSYTTRRPRYEGETGHIFITEEEFNTLGELAAYTFYNGKKYGTTVQQVDTCNIYVIDVPGVETLLQKYNTDRTIYIIYFDVGVYTRINRMLQRGDDTNAIVARLLQDEKADWLQQLRDIADKYNKPNLWVYPVNAELPLKQVMEELSWMVRF